MREQREIKAQQGNGHPPYGIPGQGFVKEIHGSGAEDQQQRVMPYLRRKLNHGRKEADENKADQGSSAAKVVRNPRVENPAEERAGNDRRQAEHQFRHSKRTPEMKQKHQERRMGDAQTSLIGQPPRLRIRRTKMQSFIRIEKSSVCDPETKQKPSRDDNCHREINMSLEPGLYSGRSRLPARGSRSLFFRNLWLLSHPIGGGYQ